MGLALLAAGMAVLLFAPAQRFVRSFFLQMRPPEWAADYIAPAPLATAGLVLHFLLPALAALLWVRGRQRGNHCNHGGSSREQTQWPAGPAQHAAAACATKLGRRSLCSAPRPPASMHQCPGVPHPPPL